MRRHRDSLTFNENKIKKYCFPYATNINNKMVEYYIFD